MKKHTITPSLVTVSLLSLFTVNPLWADDTELYLNQINLPPVQTRPNVVFVLDSSGSMGLPVSQYGTASKQETANYSSTTIYAGQTNFNGGPGSADYIYLYERPNTYADQYVYYNKVHVNQMDCTNTGLSSTTHYNTTGDHFIFNDGTSDWGHMCKETDNNCSFTSAATGPKVDCESEAASNTITDTDDYPSKTLYAFNSNFHNFLQSYYRYSVLQTVVKDLIDRPFDINMSVMEFNSNNGGIVIKESVDANDANNQADLKAVVSDIYFHNSTPLTESLWEAARYLRGETATYGTSSVAAAFSNAATHTYDSPIHYACQKSHIILLTDGNPYSDNGRDADINTLTGSTCSHSNNADAANESCLDDLAGWLHTDGANRRDHSTGVGGLPGDQSISVHTIGFGLDNPLLTATAANGGGLSRTAATASELASAFSVIINQVEFEKDTFVAPAVAVNAYNGLQHRDELYFALFQPNASPRWAGNIKKFKLDGAVIRDSNNNPAIDPTTGYFFDTSLSYWTSPVDLDNDGNVDFITDGGNVSIGGVATLLNDPDARTIYTYTSTSLPNNVTLSEQLNVANTNITTSMLGVNGAANPALERAAVINWARGGVTASPPPNYFLADFIHNRPSVVTYQTIKTVDSNGNVTNVRFDDTIYAASNMGFFHAIDADNGSEVFSFVPRAMLGNLTTYYQNAGGFNDKVYGLDAPMTVWRFDGDNDGNIVTSSGTIDGSDHVYIYQPMRRGGTSIYAMDVTLRNSPKLMWQIIGKAFGSSPSGDFRDLAQTWSVPQRGKIRWNCTGTVCTDRDVLFFGGGYDFVHDAATSPTTSSKGNALYMVDARTGALLWSAGNGSHHDLNLNTMNNSIPANVTIGDVDSDGYIDFLFAIDIQGGLWRMDFAEHPDSATNFATGGRIAELGGTGANFRRFFNAPDVAYFVERGTSPFLTISVASGYRAHPRNISVNDYLFVIFDQNALNAPASNNYNYVSDNTTIDFSDLSAAGTVHGWYKSLSASGEKGLSRTITFGDKIIMTTYVPSFTTSCTGSTGGGKYYLLDAFNGNSLLKDANNNTLQYKELTHSGIPPEPAVIYSTEDVCVADCGDPTEVLEERTNLIVCIGTECIDDVADQKLHKTFWREN